MGTEHLIIFFSSLVLIIYTINDVTTPGVAGDGEYLAIGEEYTIADNFTDSLQNIQIENYKIYNGQVHSNTNNESELHSSIYGDGYMILASHISQRGIYFTMSAKVQFFTDDNETLKVKLVEFLGRHNGYRISQQDLITYYDNHQKELKALRTKDSHDGEYVLNSDGNSLLVNALNEFDVIGIKNFQVSF